MVKCTLDGRNAKTLAKAIQSLSKFGTYLFVEGLQDELQLRTVNISKSAVATIKFKRNFFEKYAAAAGEESYCKISFKTCLTVFRNMKQVEQCEMQIIPEESKMLVQLKSFKLETVKDAYISILDEENISAVFASDTENCIIGSHKLFSDLVGNFNSAEEEVTFEAKKDHLTAKNYIEGSRVFDKFMRSQLRLSAMEFDNYRIRNDTTVTFALKEFRALILFAESLNEGLTLNFDDSGSPIFVNVNNADDVYCLLVMSTLSYDDVSFYESCQRSDAINTNTPTAATTKRKLRHSNNTIGKNASKVPKSMASDTTQSLSSTIFPFIGEEFSANSDIALPRGAIAPITERSTSPRMALTNTDTSRGSKVQQSAESVVTFQSTDGTDVMDVDDCVIPQSPTRQKEWHQVRTIFSRCFEPTYVPEKPMPGTPFYVENSDTED